MITTIGTVFIVYFVAVFAIGLWAGKSTSNSTESFYLGDRNISGVLTALTYLASMVSAGALIGWTSLAMLWGPYFIWVAVFFTLAIFLTWFTLAPRVMTLAKKTGSITVPDFIQARFGGKAPRLLSGLVLLIFLVPLLSANYSAAGLLIERLTPFGYEWGVWIFGVVVFLYVAFGGFRAVVWTDAVQGVVLAIGAFMVFVAAAWTLGLGELSSALSRNNPDGMLSWPSGPDPSQSYFIAFILLNFCGAFGAPYFLVRFFSVKSAKSLRNGYITVVSMVVILEVVIVMIGLYARGLFPELVNDPDSTFMVMTEELLPTFLVAVVFAALAAAMMSTIDTILLAVASTVENDVITHGMGIRVSGQQRVVIARATILVIGIISIVLALNPPELLAFLLFPAFGVLGLVFGSLFLLGVYWPRFNRAGAIAILVTAPVSFVAWDQLGNPFGIYHIQVALVATAITSVVATYLTPPPEEPILRTFFGNREKVLVD